MLNVGDKAYNFTLSDKDGNNHSLSDYLGKKVVVYFYPKDNTPGCTRQACAFRNNFDEFGKRNVMVIGISQDSGKSHQKFIDTHNLPFLILSDPDLNAIKGFGVWQEKTLYGRLGFGVNRSTFIVDENGFIEKVFPKANPDNNASDILKYLDTK
jgi:peroxiredoxin Q/BCP